MDNNEIERSYGRTPEDLLADTAHNTHIKNFAIASLLAAALFICASTFIYIKTTISHHHTISLLNDTFWLHDVLQRINHQVEFLFNSHEYSDNEAGFLNNFKETLKIELIEAQRLEKDIIEIAEIKRNELFTPVQDVVQESINNDITRGFSTFYSSVNSILLGEEDLVGGLVTWRQTVTVNNMRVASQYDQLLNNLIVAAKNELQLYNNIQIGILISVAGVLLVLWFGVYKPLMNQLRQQHQKAINNYFEVHRKAREDELTKLANRLAFNEAIQQLLSNKTCANFVLLNFDIDYFKEINDQFGHSAGDDALIHFASHLSTYFNNADCVARLGGDEFAVLIDHRHVPNLELVISQITDPISVRVSKNEVITLGVSAGAAIYGLDGVDQKTLLRNADRSLYVHKMANKAAVSPKERHKLPADILHSIQKGINNDEFYTVFQPIVSLDGLPVGIESLVRWRNPMYKDVPITLWFKAAETSDAAVIITGRVVSETINLYKLLNDDLKSMIDFNINISGPIETVCRCLNQVIDLIQGEPEFARHLFIEFTESIDFSSDDSVLIGLINTLRNYGTRFSFDDFGTGYATLVNLQGIPVQQIKIDRKFVKSIEQPRTSKIVRGMVDMSRRLNIQVVAEGVEKPEQISELKKTRCHQMQGNYICKPISMEQVFSWLVRKCATTKEVQKEA